MIRRAAAALTCLIALGAAAVIAADFAPTVAADSPKARATPTPAPSDTAPSPLDSPSPGETSPSPVVIVVSPVPDSPSPTPSPSPSAAPSPSPSRAAPVLTTPSVVPLGGGDALPPQAAPGAALSNRQESSGFPWLLVVGALLFAAAGVGSLIYAISPGKTDPTPPPPAPATPPVMFTPYGPQALSPSRSIPGGQRARRPASTPGMGPRRRQP